MPKIQSVSVCVARVPLDVVTAFATRTVTARDYCLVKVRSTDGVEGIGFCYVGRAGGRLPAGAGAEPPRPRALDPRAGVSGTPRARRAGARPLAPSTSAPAWRSGFPRMQAAGTTSKAR